MAMRNGRNRLIAITEPTIMKAYFKTTRMDLSKSPLEDYMSEIHYFKRVEESSARSYKFHVPSSYDGLKV